jgi:hypothetical protein
MAARLRPGQVIADVTAPKMETASAAAGMAMVGSAGTIMVVTDVKLLPEQMVGEFAFGFA